jgi:hypothetical protein
LVVENSTKTQSVAFRTGENAGTRGGAANYKIADRQGIGDINLSAQVEYGATTGDAGVQQCLSTVVA